MAKTKEAVIEAEEVSTSKAEFLKLIEVYKKQNPEKYEAKKDRLEAKLRSL